MIIILKNWLIISAVNQANDKFDEYLSDYYIKKLVDYFSDYMHEKSLDCEMERELAIHEDKQREAFVFRKHGETA